MHKDTGGMTNASYIPVNESLVKEGHLFNHYDTLDDRQVSSLEEGKFWIPNDVIKAVDAYAGIPVCHDKASPLLGVIIRLHNIYYKRHMRVVKDLHKDFRTQTEQTQRKQQNSKSYKHVVSEDFVHDLKKQIKILTRKLNHYERCEKFMAGLEKLPKNWELSREFSYHFKKPPPIQTES